MSELFEVYGYPVGDRSAEADEWRRSAECPFIGAECDGGGNRYMTNIRFSQRPRLQHLYPTREEIPSGVCSLMGAEASPWIVCPRRLLVLGRAGSTRAHQDHVEAAVLRYAGFDSGDRIGVWTEVKFKNTIKQKVFDYTFDYVLMNIGDRPLPLVASAIRQSTSDALRTVTGAGYKLRRSGTDYVVEDFPYGPPVIIEIMTSSTSGSNKDKGTTIRDAFEHAILGDSHVSPGINKRQVWARMVSQLIVKSEVAMEWGGRTLWIVQDNLVDYISATTGLNMSDFISTETSEVNVVAVSYNHRAKGTQGIIELDKVTLYAGPISSGDDSSSAFVDIIRSPAAPPVSTLFELLAKRGPAAETTVVE